PVQGHDLRRVARPQGELLLLRVEDRADDRPSARLRDVHQVDRHLEVGQENRLVFPLPEVGEDDSAVGKLGAPAGIAAAFVLAQELQLPRGGPVDPRLERGVERTPVRDLVVLSALEVVIEDDLPLLERLGGGIEELEDLLLPLGGALLLFGLLRFVLVLARVVTVRRERDRTGEESNPQKKRCRQSPRHPDKDQLLAPQLTPRACMVTAVGFPTTKKTKKTGASLVRMKG